MIVLLSCGNGVLHQPRGMLVTAGMLITDSLTLVWFCLRELWLVVIVLRVSLPFWERTLGSGLVTSYLLDKRRVQPVFLWPGGPETSSLFLD